MYQVYDVYQVYQTYPLHSMYQNHESQSPQILSPTPISPTMLPNFNNPHTYQEFAVNNHAMSDMNTVNYATGATGAKSANDTNSMISSNYKNKRPSNIITKYENLNKRSLATIQEYEFDFEESRKKVNNRDNSLGLEEAKSYLRFMSKSL